jgi:ATP-dependent Clp protease ATP-binding subunit ClpA
VEDPLSNQILDGTIVEGDKVSITLQKKSELKFKVSK